MARKRVQRDLPFLAELHPGFSGYPAGENHTAALEKALRRLIATQRRRSDRPFYAMREVAAFFRVNFRTTARIYKMLEGEGLLKIVRGSKSLIRGRRPAPAHPVLGVVGVPVPLPSLIFGAAGRAFYSLLERELRRRRFVADFIFYHEAEEGHPDLAERFREHALDTLFWMSPSSQAASTILSMLDDGVSVVMVNDGKGTFPRQQYRLDLEAPYRTALADWRSSGVDSIEIWAPAAGGERHILQTMERVVARVDTPFAVVELADANVPRRVRALARQPATGVILISHQWYDGLCAQFPNAMARLFAQHRVLLPQEPIYHPGFAGRAILADCITMDYARMALRVASDIAEGNVNTDRILSTFRGEYVPRLNLGSVKRDF